MSPLLFVLPGRNYYTKDRNSHLSNRTNDLLWTWQSGFAPGVSNHDAHPPRIWFRQSRAIVSILVATMPRFTGSPVHFNGYLGMTTETVSRCLGIGPQPLSQVARAIKYGIAQRFAFAPCCGSWSFLNCLPIEQWEDQLVVTISNDVPPTTITSQEFLVACRQFLATSELILQSTAPKSVSQCF